MAVVDLRYARALDEVVVEQRLPRDQVKQQLQDFQATFTSSAPLREVMGNPSIPEEQKLRLLDSLAARIGMNKTVRNFVAVVIGHERLQEFPEIVAAYLELADRDSGIAEAEVTSARPLDEAGRRTLEASIAQLAGSSRVRATYRQDPGLLGGAVIKLGSTVYDGSVRGQLEQMKERLVGAAE
jgi:F-type H+-transporting ATPase subunit delta